MFNINLIYYLLAGTIFGLLALKTGIPAAPLAGALIGASNLSISGKFESAVWPNGTRTLLEIGKYQIKIPLKEILESKDRNKAGTTINPRGLTFLGPSYENITKLKPEKSPLI